MKALDEHSPHSRALPGALQIPGSVFVNATAPQTTCKPIQTWELNQIEDLDLYINKLLMTLKSL